MDLKAIIKDSLEPWEFLEVMDITWDDLEDNSIDGYIENNREDIIQVLADVFGIEIE